MFLGPPESITQARFRSVQPFLHSSRQRVVGLARGHALSPESCPLAWGSGPHLIYASLSSMSPNPKRHLDRFSRLWRPSVKRFALSYRTVVCPVLSILSVCRPMVGVLWPNGWMDQVETWHAGRPRPRSHSVRWGPSSPPKEHSPHFSANVRCGWMD